MAEGIGHVEWDVGCFTDMTKINFFVQLVETR